MEVEFKFADDNQRDLSSKFGSNHYLGNAKNVDHVLLWSTFFRRNLHRFVLDYLKIGLHLYHVQVLLFNSLFSFFYYPNKSPVFVL